MTRQIHLTVNLNHLDGPEVAEGDLVQPIIEAFMDYFEGYEFSNISVDGAEGAIYELTKIMEAHPHTCAGCGISFFSTPVIAEGDYKWTGEGFVYNDYHNTACMEATHEKEGMS